MIRRARRSTLFPYTTLFRSGVDELRHSGGGGRGIQGDRQDVWSDGGEWDDRAAEHTSELQSPDHHVCRLHPEKRGAGGADEPDGDGGEWAGGVELECVKWGD